MIVSADTDTARCHQEIADRTEARHRRTSCTRVITDLLDGNHRCTFAERECCECRPVAVADLRRARRTCEFITARQDRNARSGREEELTHPARVDHRKERRISDYIEGLNMLASMRLCANTPGQLAIQTALGGYQSINDLVKEGGRLRRQRDLAYELITAIPGVTCVKPQAALYMFPKLDPKVYPISDDRQFFLELLRETRVMLVQGTGFNWHAPDHFRIVFLPHEDDLREAIGRIAKFLESYRKRNGN